MIDERLEATARCLGELGHPVRLAVFRLLVRAGPEGAVVGDLLKHVDIPKSTLSHHLQHLIMVGLVHQRREGRSLRCFVDGREARAMLDYLLSECCQGLTDMPACPASEPSDRGVA
ncbi:ArsR/SmtB family transcription factor [Roseospira goensis]|uniref:DNA-binding transcriptional ArsR family regulator n=1 Tax=Roseospira goensis TaxID=391922 RepID=A0A7W6WK52_9PROT|nr:metalloregulator ArsR/SmtB family transcription factor [Roseospira goensis]MBB4285404.1 DNA-binding transcriptional ArsR family regulator [Roseospira goensis]